MFQKSLKRTSTFTKGYFQIMLSTLSVVQHIPQENKHRDNTSHSTSNNGSQAQEFNIPDAFVNSLNRNTKSLKQGLYLQWSFSCNIPNFATGSGKFCSISLPINLTDSGLEISRTFIFHQISLNCHKKVSTFVLKFQF